MRPEKRSTGTRKLLPISPCAPDPFLHMKHAINKSPILLPVHVKYKPRGLNISRSQEHMQSHKTLPPISPQNRMVQKVFNFKNLPRSELKTPHFRCASKRQLINQNEITESNIHEISFGDTEEKT